MKTNCLVDFFSEEIPAQMQIYIETELKLLFEKEIKSHSLQFKNVEVFTSPRHFSIFINEVDTNQKDKIFEIKGPRTNAPEKAINGFLKNYKINKNKLKIVKNKKGEFYFYNKTSKGKNISTLMNGIINNICHSISWPKSQRWANSDFKWGRPLRNILVLIGNKKANGFIKIGRNNNLKFSNFTYGHRSILKKIYINSPEEFINKMKKNNVYIKRSDRKKIIERKIFNLLKINNLSLYKDESLLEEVIGLVEYPNVLIGKIEKEFMILPFRILSTVMKVHQKYFSLVDEYGKVTPYFLVITNSLENKDSDKIILQGYERVLKARLSDALFFWKTDINKNFDNYLDKLKTMVFYENLGSIYDRSLRISKMCKKLGTLFSINENCKLKALGLYSKLDLCSNLVFEFPELQGVMLKFLARNNDYDTEMQKAFEDQYKPLGLNKEMPVNNLGCILSISNNVDTLTNFFSIGLQPTGSRDPLGIRRAANSLINVMWNKCDNLSFRNIFYLVDKNNFKSFDTLKSNLNSFLIERLKNYLLDQGYKLDKISSITLSSDIEEKSFSWIKNNIKNLEKFLVTDIGKKFISNFKRIENITKKSKMSFSDDKVRRSKLVKQEELDFYDFLLKLRHLIKKRNLEEFDKSFFKIADEFNLLNKSFFENILVNDRDNTLKENRHNLLNSIKNCFYYLCRFDLINN